MKEAETPERGWEGALTSLSSRWVQSDLVRHGGSQVGACGWEMTPEGTPKPQLQKERHQALAGEPPVPLRNEGNSEEERSRVGATQRDRDLYIF